MRHAVLEDRARHGPNKQPPAPCAETSPHPRRRPDTFGSLRRAVQFSDWQVDVPRQVAHPKFDHLPDIAADLGLRVISDTYFFAGPTTVHFGAVG